MADLTRTITLTVPDAYVARITAWITAMPPLMQDSGTVDEFGDPIMEPVPETLPVRFDRVAKEILTNQILTFYSCPLNLPVLSCSAPSR